MAPSKLGDFDFEAELFLPKFYQNINSIQKVSSKIFSKFNQLSLLFLSKSKTQIFQKNKFSHKKNHYSSQLSSSLSSSTSSSVSLQKTIVSSSLSCFSKFFSFSLSKFVIIFLAIIPSMFTVSADDTLETLDRFICLRPTGFFPHDVQCDHFYECRNSTIINEGICKTGLRFDYRYRKKPRCITADLIDCRITQIDLDSVPEFISEEDFTDSQDNTSTTTDSTSVSTSTSTTTSTTTETSKKSEFWMGNRPRNHHNYHSSRNRYNPQPLLSTTTSTTSTTTTTKPLPEDESDEIINSAEVDSEPNENDLTRRQRLTRKPLQLRRGSLQESSAAAHYSISTSRALSSHSGRSISSTEDDIVSGNRLTSHVNTIKSRSSRHGQCPTPNGYFADREDCRKFYACDDGRAFPMSCPLGLAYDELTGTCNWPDMVDGCRGEEMLRFTCPDPYESDVLDYGDPRYPTSDCRKFVVCVVSELYGARTPRLLGCEEGLVFNPNSRSCDLPENVSQCANYYTDRGYPSNYFRRAQLREQNARKRRLRH